MKMHVYRGTATGYDGLERVVVEKAKHYGIDLQVVATTTTVPGTFPWSKRRVEKVALRFTAKHQDPEVLADFTFAIGASRADV